MRGRGGDGGEGGRGVRNGHFSALTPQPGEEGGQEGGEGGGKEEETVLVATFLEINVWPN